MFTDDLRKFITNIGDNVKWGVKTLAGQKPPEYQQQPIVVYPKSPSIPNTRGVYKNASKKIEVNAPKGSSDAGEILQHEMQHFKYSQNKDKFKNFGQDLQQYDPESYDGLTSMLTNNAYSKLYNNQATNNELQAYYAPRAYGFLNYNLPQFIYNQMMEQPQDPFYYAVPDELTKYYR